MKIAGIIAEYNPFHNGHARHIALTREKTGCDYVIVCMDGHFTQRGEPALWSKWARARMALSCGADAVFELPAAFAVRTADAFARGGVAILGALGADWLAFGCETEDPGLLRALANLRREEPPRVSEGIRAGLERGLSHARAWGEAAGEMLGISPELINRPNLILGSEYVRAIDELDPQMRPVVILREGDYHDGTLGRMASATAIRTAILRGDMDGATGAIPAAARPFATPDALHAMDDMLLMRLRGMSIDEMAALPDMGEGLEHRLYRLCRATATREALLEALKCKRYTRARLSRVLTHAMLGVTQAELEARPLPGYARLLGARRGTEDLLRELSRRSRIPIAASAKELRGNPVFDLECRATDCWALLHDAPTLRLPGREFTEKFVRI